MTSLDAIWLRVYRDVGADRYLSHAELPVEAATARSIWEVYDRLFGRFTGAGLDPLFTRFTHSPSRLLASPLLPRGVPVLITGIGPSLDAGCDELRRVRDRLIVASSLRGAEALQTRGLHADLVLVEHQTVFDAQASADDRHEEPPLRLHAATSVLAHVATPPGLLHDVDADACRLADALPTWGLWPATLVALALEAGAPAVGLLGIDLGVSAPASTDERVPPSSAYRPLFALLELLGGASGICRDCGVGGVQKAGWPYASLSALAASATASLRREPSRPITWADERSPSVLLDEARHDLTTVRPLVQDARAGLELALQARAGNPPANRELTRAIELMLAWGADPHLRHVLQRGLGLSFLPRLWRTGIRINGATQLWRPLMLALHELTTQVDRLTAVVDAARVAPAQVDPSGSWRDSWRDTRLTSAAAPTETADDAASRHGGGTIDGASAAASSIGVERGRREADADPSRARRVSVILPVKNGLPHLHDAIASLIGQTHPDVEILVIDDGSDDGGPEEIQARALSHVRVVPSNGQGPAAALNTGLRLATGAFVARQDADDWSHPERLARQVDYLSRHPEIDVLATCAEFVDVDGRPIETAWTTDVRRRDDGVQTPEALARQLPRTCALQHGTVMARRDVLRQAGGYRPALVFAQDYDLSLRLLPRARFAKLPARLYTYRVHDRQTSRQQRDQLRRALIRARLELVLRQAPRLTTDARIRLAADARTAQVYREIGRDIGLAFADETLPPLPDITAMPDASRAGVSPTGDAAAAAAAARDRLAGVDALVIADVDAGDAIDAWLAALAAAGDADWIDVGICLVRRAWTAR